MLDIDLRPFKELNGLWLLVLFAGIICLVLGYTLDVVGEDWQNGLQKLGELIIVGVLFGILSSHRTITDNYRKELEELLYGDKFLQKRNDIAAIWNHVTDALVSSNLPESIRSKAYETIKDFYLLTKPYYYSGYEETIKVAWHKDSTELVDVHHETEFEIIAASTAPIKMQYSNSSETKVAVTPHLVFRDRKGGKIIKEIKPSDIEPVCTSESGDKQALVYDYQIEGYTRYHVTRLLKKHYNIKDDGAYIAEMVSVITDGMSVDITYPKDIEVHFVDLGTITPFKRRSPKERKGSGCWLSGGIVMPNQGFCFVMEINKKSKKNNKTE